jgi:hypothetical protein
MYVFTSFRRPLGALALAALLAAAAAAPRAQQPCAPGLNFDTDSAGSPLPAGTIVDTEYQANGISVTTQDPAAHPAMIFDTANPTGEDPDLATPGYGPDNTVARGNVLIVSEDGDPLDPDDDSSGGTLIFTFDQDYTVRYLSILDIDEDESGMATAYDGGGAAIASVAFSPLGDNSFQRVYLNAVGARRLEVTFSNSGALVAVHFFCETSNLGDVDLTVTPNETSVPSTGGTLTFGYEVVNSGATAYPLELEAVVRRLNESRILLRQPILSDTLQASSAITSQYALVVPGSAPDQEYRITFTAGRRLGRVIYDRQTFVFAKGAPPRHGSPSSTEDYSDPFGAPVAAPGWAFASAYSAGAAPALMGYPNPFGAQTTLRYEVSAPGTVRLSVYDVLGREVARLVDGLAEAGTYEVPLDASALPSGTYLIRLVTNGAAHTQRLTRLD